MLAAVSTLGEMTLTRILEIGVDGLNTWERFCWESRGDWRRLWGNCGGICKEEIPRRWGWPLGLGITWEFSVTGVEPTLGRNLEGVLDGVVCSREAPLPLFPRPLVVASLGFFFLTDNNWDCDCFSAAELDSDCSILSESRSTCLVWSLLRLHFWCSLIAHSAASSQCRWGTLAGRLQRLSGWVPLSRTIGPRLVHKMRPTNCSLIFLVDEQISLMYWHLVSGIILQPQGSICVTLNLLILQW